MPDVNEAQDQDVQEDLVVEIEEDDAPAGDDQQVEAPEPEEPKKPVAPEPKKPEPAPAAPGAEARPVSAGDDDDDDESSLSEKVRKRIGKLTAKQRRAERERDEYRQQLEAIERERQQERQQYEARTTQSDDLIIASREEALKSEKQRAEADYLAAYRSGDEAALIAAQGRMVEVQVSQTELARVKQRRDAMRGQTTQAQTPQFQNPPSQSAPDPAVVRQHEKARELADDYIAKYHEWWDKDEVLTSAVLGIDKRMQAEGMKPWEPDFYEELDRRLQRRFPGEFGAPERAAPAQMAPQSRPSQPVAGVSRGAAKGTVPVRLTAEDKAFCERNGIDLNAYAKEKHALERSARQ